MNFGVRGLGDFSLGFCVAVYCHLLFGVSLKCHLSARAILVYDAARLMECRLWLYLGESVHEIAGFCPSLCRFNKEIALFLRL